MNKHLISAGHTQVNPRLLEFVLNDNPQTKQVSRADISSKQDTLSESKSHTGGFVYAPDKTEDIYVKCYYSGAGYENPIDASYFQALNETLSRPKGRSI